MFAKHPVSQTEDLQAEHCGFLSLLSGTAETCRNAVSGGLTGLEARIAAQLFANRGMAD